MKTRVRQSVAGAPRAEAHRSAVRFQRYGPCRRLQFQPDQGVAEVYEDNAGAEITLTLVGRKGRDYYRRRNGKILNEYINILNRPSYQEAADIAKEVIRRYREGETDAVYVLNNEFKSVMTQTLSVMQLLPVDLSKDKKGEAEQVERITSTNNRRSTCWSG